MRNPPMPTIRTNVAPAIHALAMLCVSTLGCAERERAPMYRTSARSARTAELPACASPARGCPCDDPGTLADCGEVVERTDEYVTCTQGVRICTDDGIWGECAGALATQATPPPGDKTIAALGSAVACSEQNPCDPLCREIADTGVGLTNLPEGLCSMASGIGICPLCGYSGPVGVVSYATMPDEWRRIPATCSTTDDRCPMDTVCVGNTCQTRAYECASVSESCAVDLTLGKPCINDSGSYHVPVCNRGSHALTSGTIRIGIDNRSSTTLECVPIAVTDATDATVGYPNAGSISFTLAHDERIDPGTCVDVNPNNSQATGVELNGNRAFLVNYDGGVGDCNRCNNGSVFIVDSPVSDISVCSACNALECSQTNPATTLRGVVYDPAGIRPLPNVFVYVPNGEVAQFVDGVACDTCDSLITGAPLVSATTDATGHFALANMPSDAPFSLVVQIGRWRRQVAVAPIQSGTTRWIRGRSADNVQFALSADATEPTPAEPAWRLRLPRTQRRCTATGCGGEGDIPRMAVMMGDADPVQCALRRIGIADSEFTPEWEDGRAVVVEAAGMRVPNSRVMYGGSDSFLSSTDLEQQPTLNGYSMLLAPCDVSNAEPGGSYASSPYASGPSYNSRPNAGASWYERGIVKDFVDAGGRLLTTHWMAMDFVYLNYEPPTRARFVTTSSAASLDSPFRLEGDPAVSTAVSTYALVDPGFAWRGFNPEEYNPTAPAVFLFGNNVEAGSSRSHDPAVNVSERFAPLGYDISQGSALGTTFAAWAIAVGATAASGSGRLRWREWSPMVRLVRPELPVVPLLVGDSREAARFEWTSDPLAQKVGPVGQQPCLQNDGSAFDCTNGATWGDQHVAMFQFDTPVGAAEQCGRVGVTSGHVSQHACFAPHDSRGSAYCEQLLSTGLGSPTPDCACLEFPEHAELACGTFEMSEEERAFEFLLFSVSQCMGQKKNLARPQRLSVTTMTRDFEASCAEDEQVVWQLLSWRATIPDGTWIEFHGASADTQAGLDAASFIPIGVADATTTTWTAGHHTVDQYFRRHAEPPEVSRRWLRVNSVLFPQQGESPILSEWRVVFNCTRSE